MTILIRRAIITDKNSPYNQATKDILIKNGVIEQIADHVDGEFDHIIEKEGLHVSPGWVDLFVHFNDPGYEFRETLESGASAAAAGGFTHVFVIPNTKPAIHNKSMVEYIAEKQVSSPVKLHPLGAITRNTEGRELAEMYDMRQSGAIAFTDGLLPVQSAGLMIKALQYVKAFDGILIQIPDDKSISPNGLMNEGVVSTQLGLPGKPAMSEEIMVARDIKLTRYAESRLHFTAVSSAKSLEYIGRAKAGGIGITCSITPQHLFFTDEDLRDYDTNLKSEPPFRSEADKTALREAVINGTVDCITSHHIPQDWDNKVCEFEYAKPGMTGLESAFGILGTLDIPLEKILDCLCFNPRRIFNLPVASVKEGLPADLTVYLPGEKFIFNEEMIRSRSKNSPFIGKGLKGKVVGTILGNKTLIN